MRVRSLCKLELCSAHPWTCPSCARTQAFLSQLQAQDSGSSMEDLALSGVLSEAATGAAGQLGSAPAAAAEAAAAAAAKQVLVAQVDPVAWKLEVERVAPKLRAAQAASAADGSMRDWRQHLEAAHTHMAALAATWPAVKCVGRQPGWSARLIGWGAAQCGARTTRRAATQAPLYTHTHARTHACTRCVQVAARRAGLRRGRQPGAR
jgi:hypothetical protein